MMNVQVFRVWMWVRAPFSGKTSGNKHVSSVLLFALCFIVLAAHGFADQAGTSPVKVFILAGQSNMQGHGEISPVTTPGTLESTLANDVGGTYQFTREPSGQWKRWNDVWIRYERSSSEKLSGDLTVGYGARSTLIGPEIGFGHEVGAHYDHQVLLIKTAWGGKSLGNDFRPPSSGPYASPTAPGDTGFYYQEMLRIVNDVTSNLATYFPDYDGQGFEIAGFGWHQGWNDRVSQTFTDEYEVNLANLIRDVRKDLGIIDLPFVVANTGIAGLSESQPRALALMNAQLAVAQYPEFQGTVAAIDTRGFWRNPSDSPSPGGGQGFHWNRNAATYLDIGLAMGRAAVDIISNKCPTTLLADGDERGINLTWRRSAGDPSAVRILRNSEQIANLSSLDHNAYTDLSATPGVLNYELIATVNGVICEPLTFSYDGSIRNFVAGRDIGRVVLSWVNQMPYAGIEIRRNGQVIAASLSGSAESFVDSSPPLSGTVTYAIQPINGTTTPATTQVNMDAPLFADLYWEANGGAVGDGASSGGAGGWELSSTNWDRGPGLSLGAWINGNDKKAIFGGSAGAVALNENITLNALEVRSPFYQIGASVEDHLLNFSGSSPTLLIDGVSDTVITAGISGSPTVRYLSDSGNYDSVLTFAPSGNFPMTLGVLEVIRTDGNSAVWLSGDRDGNAVDRITWTRNSNQLQIRKKGQGSWQIRENLDIRNGRLYVDEGALTCLGTDHVFSHRIEVGGGGRLNAAGSWLIQDVREHFTVHAGGTIAPGNGIGSMSLNWSSNRADTAKLSLRSGSVYEWEVGPGNVSDTIHVGKTLSPNVMLEVGEMTLRVVSPAGSPKAADQIPVFTYDVGVTRVFGNVFVDLSATNWTGTPRLVDDNNGRIYLTGVSAPALPRSYQEWAVGGEDFDGDANQDGVQDGLAFVLGAATPTTDASQLLPTTRQTAGGDLVFEFLCRDFNLRGGVQLRVAYSADLGLESPWTSTADQVPDVSDSVPDNGVTFQVDASSAAPLLRVTATIDADEAANVRSLFGRLEVSQ